MKIMLVMSNYAKHYASTIDKGLINGEEGMGYEPYRFSVPMVGEPHENL